MAQAIITDDNYFEFKNLYVTAHEKGALTFEFEGQQILTAYAKYVCEFVDGQNLKKQKAELN
jgi:hypothetical protein